MEEVQYYKEVYNKFWEKQTKKYGYSVYEKSLVRLIARSNPQNVFEVGIGTGWPIGAALKKKGIRVCGCDLAESAVLSAREILENEEGIWEGDVLSYEGKEQFDVVYCVRASWYIPNYYATLKKMISMTKAGGYIVFDVMDNFSLYCMRLNAYKLSDKYFRLWGWERDKIYGQHFIDPVRLKLFLRKNGLRYRCWGEREITKSTDIWNTPKIVFLCRRER